MRVIISIIVAFLISFFISFLYGWTLLILSTPVQQYQQIDREKIERLMRYHGTLIAVRTHKGWMFPRNGKLCRLWDPEKGGKNER